YWCAARTAWSGVVGRHFRRRFSINARYCRNRCQLSAVRDLPANRPWWFSQRHHRAAPGHAPAKGKEQDGIAGMNAVGADRFVEREGHGGGGSVAAAIDVDHDLFAPEAEVGEGGVDDALVGLMGDDESHVGRGKAAAVESVADHLADALHGEAE